MSWQPRDTDGVAALFVVAMLRLSDGQEWSETRSRLWPDRPLTVRFFRNGHLAYADIWSEETTDAAR